MRIPFLLLCLAGLLAGCEAQKPVGTTIIIHQEPSARSGVFFAPSPRGASRGTVAPANAPGNLLLPGSDGDYFIPRGENFVYGGYLTGAVSDYTIYTYDSQNISIQNSGASGYRYRWIVQQGSSSP